jgi:hypothetical protein
MLIPFTDDVSLVGRGQRLASWHLSAGAAALVNFRRGSVSGPIQFQVQLPLNTSASQAYPSPLYFGPEGLFVECSVAINAGCVDVI